MVPVRVPALVLVLAFLAAMPAGAGMLYKSIDADGVLMFSDAPPPADARVLETRIIGSDVTSGPADATAAMTEAAQLIDSDAALESANAQVDLAEHALALARRDTWSPRDGLQLAPTRIKPEDDARLQFYKRNVAAARQALMDLLRERRLASRQ